MNSLYKFLNRILSVFFKKKTIFKWLFNLSPMYRRTTGKVMSVSDDLHRVEIKIPINYKNRNYVGTIFGGSLFSATDPICVIQLLEVLGKDYIVWDKSATIRFKKPAKDTVYCSFIFNDDEINNIRKIISLKQEMNLTKSFNIVDKNQKIYAEVEKTIYISSKEHFKTKRTS